MSHSPAECLCFTEGFAQESLARAPGGSLHLTGSGEKSLWQPQEIPELDQGSCIPGDAETTMTQSRRERLFQHRLMLWRVDVAAGHSSV